jgi:hypothetical protein
MAVFTNAFFEERVEQLFDLAALVERLFSSAGLEYRLIGGLAPPKWKRTCRRC